MRASAGAGNRIDNRIDVRPLSTAGERIRKHPADFRVAVGQPLGNVRIRGGEHLRRRHAD